MLPKEASEDADTMRRVSDLINRVYAVAEKGQWLPGATRTSIEEITEFTRARQMVVARVDGVVVGAIRVQHLDSQIGETGMLTVDPEYRNLGIGRELRRFIGHLLRSQGITALQIECLDRCAGGKISAHGQPGNSAWRSGSRRVLVAVS